MQLDFTRTGPYEYSCTVHGPTDPYVAQYNTVQLYSRRKLAGIQRSLRNPRISRNRRNLQNRNSAAAEIAIRFGPKILLKCSVRKTGPKFRTTGLTTGINLRSHSITSSIITTADRKQQAERNQLACCLQGLQAGRQIAAVGQRLPRC